MNFNDVPYQAPITSPSPAKDEDGFGDFGDDEPKG